jgi:hypothetical protein
MPARPTHASLSEIQIAAVFNALLGMSPRAIDIQVLRLQGATPDHVAEYIWDHWLSEPDEPTIECIEQEINRILANNAS